MNPRESVPGKLLHQEVKTATSTELQIRLKLFSLYRTGWPLNVNEVSFLSAPVKRDAVLLSSRVIGVFSINSLARRIRTKRKTSNAVIEADYYASIRKISAHSQTSFEFGCRVILAVTPAKESMRKTLELAGLAVLTMLCWLTWSALYGGNRLPDRVPTHFDAAGNANAWGSPTGMLILPVIAAGLYLIMSIAARFPDAFHYPVRTTAQNIAQLQAIILNMVAWIKVELACLFAVLQWAFIQAARTGQGRLFPKILPVFIVVIFGTIGLHFLALYRAATGKE